MKKIILAVFLLVGAATMYAATGKPVQDTSKHKMMMKKKDTGMHKMKGKMKKDSMK